MTMFKKTYIQSLAHSFAFAFFQRTLPSRPQDFSTDPLSHPDLSGMSLRQLADLPFDPYSLPAPASRMVGNVMKRPANPASACIAATSPL